MRADRPIICLDLETCPVDACAGAAVPPRAFAATEKDLPAAPELAAVPRNLKDPAKIAAAAEERRAAHEAAMATWASDLAATHAKAAWDWWADESFDPMGRHPHLGGRICIIGYSVGDSMCLAKLVPTAAEEAEALGHLEAVIADAKPEAIVGHNIRDFDAKFLAARALVHSLPRLANWFMAKDRYDNWLVDTMELLPVVGYRLGAEQKRRPTARLTDHARALGISLDDDPGDGSNVLRWVLAGQLDVAAAHCLSDVETVRRVHRKIIAARTAGGRP